MGLKRYIWRAQNIGVRLYLRRQGAVLAGRVDVEGLLPLIRAEGLVEIGKDVKFMCRQGPRIVLGSLKKARLRIGDGSFVNQSASIIAAIGIEIGRNAKIGPHVVIHDTTYHEVDEGAGARTEKIVIGDNVWIGRGAMILPGVTIGDHSVVGAGSVVTKSVPPKTVVAGNPARTVREVVASDSYVRR